MPYGRVWLVQHRGRRARRNLAEGAVYKLTTKWWESEHRGGNYDRRAPRKGGEVATSFVFCSKQRPAVINYDENRRAWLATPLQPGKSAAVFGALETAYAMYWVCHNTIVRNVYDEGDWLGGKLGYEFSGGGGASPDSADVSKWVVTPRSPGVRRFVNRQRCELPHVGLLRPPSGPAESRHAFICEAVAHELEARTQAAAHAASIAKVAALIA
jgi:hypothetical protein